MNDARAVCSQHNGGLDTCHVWETCSLEGLQCNGLAKFNENALKYGSLSPWTEFDFGFGERRRREAVLMLLSGFFGAGFEEILRMQIDINAAH